MAVVCLFVRLFVCPLRFFNGSWLGQMKSKFHQTFSIWKCWSLNLIKNSPTSARDRVHTQPVKTCILFLGFFCYFLFVLFFILVPFLTENEKMAALQIGMNETQLFCFIHFFQFIKEVLQNCQNVPKKDQNSTCFTSGGQNMTLRHKSPEIKKFGPEAHISAWPPFGHMQGLGLIGT